jgi:hypothetical protein
MWRLGWCPQTSRRAGSPGHAGQNHGDDQADTDGEQGQAVE